MPFRTYTFTFASAATGSNKQFVGNHQQLYLVTSGMTQWAGGTTNETISVRGGLSATDTHAAITSMTITTFTVKGIHRMPYQGIPYMSLGFATAATSAGTLDVIIYSDDL